ncbi:MAG: hypothetical protein ABW217_04985 [Polyangiaceae bacterium]
MNTKQACEPGSRRSVLPSVRNTATRLVSLGAHVAGSLLAAVCNWALVESLPEGDRPGLAGVYHETHSGR